MSDVVADSAFLSITQGFGMIGRDRALDFEVKQQATPRQQDQYDRLIELNNFAANLVELLPEAMGQKKPVFSCDDANVAEFIQSKIDAAIASFTEAAKLARLCGGAGILIGASSGEDFMQPIVPENFRGIQFLSVLEGGTAGQLTIKEIEKNPLVERYGEPTWYGLRNTRTAIDSTRVLPFYGIKPLTKSQRQRSKFWGLPVLARAFDAIRNLEIADQSIAQTLSQFSRLICKVKNLDVLLETPEGREKLRRRTEQINYSWTILKTLLLQEDEEAFNLTTDYGGMDVALSHLKEALAGSCDIPYSKLFNSGARSKGLSGASSSSQSVDRSEERQWSDYVNSKQIAEWEPHLRYLIRLWGYSPDCPARGEIEDYELTFPSILQLSETEEVGLDKTRAETAKLLAESQIATPDELASAIAKRLPLGTGIDLDARERERSLMATPPEDEPAIDPPPEDAIAADDATPAKRIIDWHGFKIGLQYQPFDLRHGRMLPVAYGHIRKTRGADGMALDCYVSTAELDNKSIYVVRQLIDGKFDEEKLMIGFFSIAQAKSTFLSIMPAEMFGGIRSETIDWLKKQSTSSDQEFDEAA